jgi:DNA-binding NarL/FixJ family response regulator
MSASNIRVVLCHAHTGLRTGLQRMLDAADGIEVVAAAAEGGAGVEAAARLSPDVVLVDLAMPRIDAAAVTQRIASLQPRTRVLILTAFPHPTRIRATLDAGASGFVLKDATPTALLSAVRTAAEGSGAARGA